MARRCTSKSRIAGTDSTPTVSSSTSGRTLTRTDWALSAPKYTSCSTRREQLFSYQISRSSRTRALLPESVHPRARGERYALVLLDRDASGSSPRARGTRPVPIPPFAAHAVHPRARGERASCPGAPRKISGSSPRAGGTRERRRCRRGKCRFIPARAGNAPMPGRLHAVPPVHPRACGERWGKHRGRGLRDGSSPRARGTLPNRADRDPQDRFIPARAGNARRARYIPQSQSVHPRARGERQSRHTWMPTCFGSSPRARGTPSPESRAYPA